MNFLNNLQQGVAKIADIALNSTKVFAATIILAAAGLGGYVIYYREMPRPIPGEVKPPADNPPPQKSDVPPPPPIPVDPVTITIHGPQPSMVISGVSSVFTCETTGPAGTPKWRLIPADVGTIRVTGSDGRRAELLATMAGRCAIVADVAGDYRQIANDQIEVEIVSLQDNPPPSEHGGNQPPQPMPAPMPAVPTVAQLAAGALANVKTADVKAEARMVAGSIRAVIGRINAGYIAPNADPVLEIETQLNHSLGSQAGNWNVFLTAVAVILEQLRQQGQVTTAASTVPTLEVVATVLQQSP